MTFDSPSIERLHLMALCERIISEQNPDRFTDLVLQLEVLLDYFHPAEELKIPSNRSAALGNHTKTLQ